MAFKHQDRASLKSVLFKWLNTDNCYLPSSQSSPHTDTLYCAGFGHLLGLRDGDGNHLPVVSVLGHPLPTVSTSQLPEDSQEMLQDSVSYWCYRSRPVILDQRHTSLDVFYSPVRKNMQNIPYQTVGMGNGFLCHIQGGAKAGLQ